MIIVSNLQFRPSELSVLPGTSIEFTIGKHAPSKLYREGERVFILESIGFTSGCLREGDSYRTEVWESQVIRCPFYPHMRCTVTVLGPVDNPQDSNYLIRKETISKPEAKSVVSSPFRPFKGPCSIPSSSNSCKGEEVEPEQIAETEEDPQFEEIQKLFLSVKEECKKDHVSCFDFEEIVCEDFNNTTEEQVPQHKEEMRRISSSETKSGVTFKIFGMGPKRNQSKGGNTQKHKKKKKKKVKPTLYLNYFLNYVRRSLAYFDINRWKYNQKDSKKKKELINRKQQELKKVILKSEEEMQGIEPFILHESIAQMKELVTDTERDVLENQAHNPMFQCYIVRKMFTCNLHGVNEKLKKIKGSDISQYSSNLDTDPLEELLNNRWINQ